VAEGMGLEFVVVGVRLDVVVVICGLKYGFGTEVLVFSAQHWPSIKAPKIK
jgi:hypothetical protein